MKKIYLSLIISLILCGAASAHILYTTEAGNLGLITVESVSSIDVSANEFSGGSGSVVASYWENNTSNGAGNSKIIFITPKAKNDTTVSGDTAVRFSSYSTLSTPIDSKVINLESTYGTPIVCGTNSGGSLYLATDATLREYKTLDFRLYNSYTYPSEDAAPNPEIKSVIKNNSKIYLLVSLNNEISNDVIVMLEGTLRPDSKYSGKWEVKNSQDVYSMNFISDSRIAVGCDDGVYHVNNNTTTSLVSTDYPVVAVHQDTGSGFYYIIQYEDNGVKTNSLRHYEDSSTDTAVASLTGITGDNVMLVKDSTHNILGVMIGEQISLINMEDDSLVKTYTSTILSGKPISLAASSTSGNSADKGGGCNSISNYELGILSLVFLGFLLMKIKFGRS